MGRRVAHGLPPLEAGHFWTILTAPLVALHPVGALVLLVVATVALFWAEGRLGSGRTAAVLVTGQLGAVR